MTINEALALHHAGRLAEADQAYRAVLAAQPNQYHALHFLGVLKAQTGDMAASAELITRSLALHPDNGLAEFHLGEALRKLDRLTDAVDHFRRALTLDPAFVPARITLAGCLIVLGHPVEALSTCDSGLEQNSGDAALLAQRGDTLVVLERRAEAHTAYDQALASDPLNCAALLGCARMLFEQGRVDDAFAAVATAISAHPADVKPLITQAVLLGELGHRGDANAVYQRALAIDPASEDVYYNMGCLLLDAGALQGALAAFDSALAINPRSVQALYNRAHTLEQLERYDDALAASDAALALDPDSGLAAGKSFLMRARRCNWPGREPRQGELERLVRSGKKVDPYILAVAFDEPELHLQAARSWAQPAAASSPQRPLISADKRLRIAYISPNFHDHPVAHMAVETFEAHDHTRFETFAICVAPGRETPIRRRLTKAFDHFVEANRASDRELADLLVQHRIDIAVDLAGYTADGRTAALWYRPAPLAVGWLGYPGTTGTSFVDYIIADTVLIPPQDERFYTEKVVRLPYSYMPRDSAAPRGPCPSRRDLGLPERGFVFCGFNNTLKFTPEIFAIWMRLLLAVNNSVLWLNSQDLAVRDNLRREAVSHDVAPERIVFADRVSARSEHLARLAAADLFLDTLPYGAHSTANDFLWAGVPVLTCQGQSFASRVAAAMLTALDLPELIAPDLASYETQALALAQNPDRLTALRAKLAAAPRRAALFDSKQFCRDIEAAYQIMAERHRAGVGPQSFSVMAP
jgi:predicted O-linked N-acetylglucosamine transferase (SPINDLY family)